MFVNIKNQGNHFIPSQFVTDEPTYFKAWEEEVSTMKQNYVASVGTNDAERLSLQHEIFSAGTTGFCIG